MKKSNKRFVVTDETLNVYGFKVRSAGGDWTRFNSNPVCTLNHNYEKILGIWEDLQLNGTEWQGTPSFDENDPEALKIADKIEQGIIKCASIGIMPIRVEGEWVEEWEMLEIAIAPVPGNKNAMVKLYGEGGVALSDSDAKKLLLSVTSENKPKNLNKSMTEKQRLAFLALCVQAGLVMQLSAASTEDEVVAAFGKVGEKMTALNLSVQQLQAAETDRKEKAQLALTAEIEAVVALAISNKVITADKGPDFIKLGAANPELCKSTLAGLTPLNLSAVIPGAEEAGMKTVEDAAKSNWTFHDYLTKDELALSAMSLNEPEKFKSLYNAYALTLRAAGKVA